MKLFGSKLVRRSAAAAAVLVIAGGLAWSAVPAHKLAATTNRPRATVTTTKPPSSANSPSNSPAVAGAATVAPPSSQPASSQHPQAPSNHQAAPATNQPAGLTLQIKASSSASFSVPYAAGLNACSILTQAKSAGLIQSVTLVYYPSYQSDYVSEINGQHDGWTFKYNGTSPPVGCSKISLNPGDTVTWTYQ